MILILLGCGNITQAKQTTLDKNTWKQSTKERDYTEHYKEPDVKKFENINPSLPKFESFKIVFYILIIAVLIFLLVLLIRSNLFSFTKKSTTNRKINFDNFEDNLPEVDLNQLLQNALENSLFIIAIRIQFLMLIKDLDQKKLILWKKNKTNGDYLLEMQKSNYFPEFQQLTLIFEKIWYGEQSPNRNQYFSLAHFYENFRTKINSNE